MWIHLNSPTDYFIKINLINNDFIIISQNNSTGLIARYNSEGKFIEFFGQLYDEKLGATIKLLFDFDI